MKTSSTATFTTTMAELKFADSLMPITRMTVTAAIPMNPNRLNTEVCVGSVAGSMLCAVSVFMTLFNSSQWPLYKTNFIPGAPAKVGDNRMPKSCSRLIQ